MADKSIKTLAENVEMAFNGTVMKCEIVESLDGWHAFAEIRSDTELFGFKTPPQKNRADAIRELEQGAYPIAKAHDCERLHTVSLNTRVLDNFTLRLRVMRKTARTTHLRGTATEFADLADMLDGAGYSDTAARARKHGGVVR